MGSRADRRSRGRSADRSVLKRVIEHIVSTAPPSRLFELYYWLQDPGLLNIVRSVASMSDNDREALESFLGLAQDLAVVTKWEGGDQLILETKLLTETFS